MTLLLDAWYNFDPFRDLYNWLADHTFDELVYVVAAVLGATGILSFVGLGALANVWLERKIIGRMQVRRGPNRVGPAGLFQPVADAIKLIQKEVLQPRASDAALFNLPPLLVFIPAMLTFAVFAWAPDMVYADLDVGVLYLLALSSVTSLAIFIAGWSSNNKYALLGAMRVIAMAISYEIPMVLVLLAPVLFAGTMNIPEIVQWQRDHHTWLAFLLPLPVLIYAIAATAELNRTPADIAEAESEIVAGFHTEYSGMKFGLFYAVELINSLAVSGIMASLFFGGYSLYGLENYIPPWIIFIGKIYFFYFGLIWLRGTLPRLRIDQLMTFAWKMLIPLAIVNIAIVATELFIWDQLGANNNILFALVVINSVLAVLMLQWSFTRMTAQFYRLPRRVRLVGEVSVPSLPAPSSVVPPAARPG